MGDLERIKELKEHPELTTQHGGCCGFAGTIMGLLLHQPREIDALYKTVSTAAKYRDITDSERVKGRLEKREQIGFLKPEAANYLDARLSLGLMILLKEYLKQHGRESTWTACVDYSKVFNGWSYGGKLKDLKEGEKPPNFSYKHGDLALTPDALSELLLMVGFEAAHTTRLISNEDLARKAGVLTSMDKDGDMKRRLAQLLDDLYQGRQRGALLGVAKEAFIGEEEQAPYEYVSHWVYVPRPKQRHTDPWDAVTWTWGELWTLRDLLQKHERVYVPKLVLSFS